MNEEVECDDSIQEKNKENYAESFHGEDHLRRILEEAQTIVNGALEGTTSRDKRTA